MTERPGTAARRDGRHVPERRCIGCGARAAKADLARFVAVRRGASAEIVRDDRGRLPGRGMYTCRERECFERAVARRAFARGARMPGVTVTADPALAGDLGNEG